MRTLAIQMWKEWRDHRSIVVAYAIAAPLLIVLGATCMPRTWWATNRDWPTVGALVGFGVAALAFGADLVSGEMRRGKLAFLARMPGGLSAAFVSKLAFFVAALFGFASFTWLVASAAGALLCGAPWFPPLAWDRYELTVWLLLVPASWLFAVSCWMPRGTFALPATALALAAWLAPVIGAFELNPQMQLRDGEFELAAAWLAISGIGVAAVSFERGWRFGGTMRTRLTWSLGPALFAIAPLWGWAGLRVREYRHLDPSEANFGLHTVAVGAGGRFAFVVGYHTLVERRSSETRDEFGAPHTLIVDLVGNSWREVGDPGGTFVHLGHRWEAASARSVVLVDGARDPKVPVFSQCVDGFDGATGKSLSSEQWKPLLRGSRGGEWFANWETYPALLPGDRLAFGVEQGIVVRDRDGTSRTLPNAAFWRWTLPRGFGFGGGNGFDYEWYYDCIRERSWRKTELGDPTCRVLAIRDGPWIVRREARERRAGTPWNTELWDPDTHEYAPIAGWRGGDVLWLHPDGRLLVVEPVPRADRLSPSGVPSRPIEGARGAVVLLDPESGSRRELALPDELARQLSQGWSYGVTIDRRLLVTLDAVDPKAERSLQQWIARFDPATDELAVIGPFGTLHPNVLGCPDPDTVIFTSDQRRLMRAHFDGRPTEILFPR